MILVVDDDPLLRYLIQTTLETPVQRVVQAEDAEEALRLIGQCVPDVILLDFHMPGMSGMELAERLRAEAATASVPIIMLTGDAGGRVAAEAAGLAQFEFLTKPFSPMQLVQKVDAAMKLRKG